MVRKEVSRRCPLYIVLLVGGTQPREEENRQLGRPAVLSDHTETQILGFSDSNVSWQFACC